MNLDILKNGLRIIEICDELNREMSLLLTSRCLITFYNLFSFLDMIRGRGLTTDPASQNTISRNENRIRNTRTPDKVFYYHLNVIPTTYIKYGLITYSGNQNEISHNENRSSNTRGCIKYLHLITDSIDQNDISRNENRTRNIRSSDKDLSPNIAYTAYIRYVKILRRQYPFGKPLYNSAN